MKLFERKSLIYRSKDEADWRKARSLLEEAGVVFSSHETEEPPAAGCGARIDIRKAGKTGKVPDRIYRIEVAARDETAARSALEGKVLPVKSYGFSV